jgi:hypothetical protein
MPWFAVEADRRVPLMELLRGDAEIVADFFTSPGWAAVVVLTDAVWRRRRVPLPVRALVGSDVAGGERCKKKGGGGFHGHKQAPRSIDAKFKFSTTVEMRWWMKKDAWQRTGG